jgi:hypothetical protein
MVRRNRSYRALRHGRNGPGGERPAGAHAVANGYSVADTGVDDAALKSPETPIEHRIETQRRGRKARS